MGPKKIGECAEKKNPEEKKRENTTSMLTPPGVTHLFLRIPPPRDVVKISGRHLDLLHLLEGGEEELVLKGQATPEPLGAPEAELRHLVGGS